MSTREELIKRAREIHDARKGACCDPKFVMSCPNMAKAIVQAGQEKAAAVLEAAMSPEEREAFLRHVTATEQGHKAFLRRESKEGA